MLQCRACGQENPEGARFCFACATPLQSEEVERRKLATLLFCDVSGSTALGERVDAESVREIMRSYFGEMRAAIEGHGGTVEKFIGDAVVAVFGVPLAHEDDALRAVRAAWEMRQRLGPLNEELDRRFGSTVALRIGVNSGEVVAGDASARQALVTGDAVNVAARLEQAATPGEILLGETTMRLVRGAVSAEPVEPLRVKGKSDPLRAYRLIDVGTASAARTRRLATPMVGRGPELDLLGRQLAEAARGRPALLTVVGEPGVGKSRLAAELMSGAGGELRILSGRCLQYGDGITYWPIVEVIREAAGIHDDHSRPVARERIEAICADGQAAIIAQAIGLDDGDAGTEDIARALEALFRSLAREGPLLLFIDDIQWAEAAVRDLIAGLPAALGAAPVAVLCLARPELLEERPDWDVSVRLEPLAEGDATALIGGLLGEGVLPAELSMRIATAAAGNPLFVEELVGMLVDDGLIERRNDRWTATGDLAIAIPATLRELLGARLDRLPHEERSALERGAVEGQVFHLGAVAELSDEGLRADIPERLRALEEREIVRAVQASFIGESAYRVRHLLIRDAAYEAIPKRLRATLHEGFAGWLGAKVGDRSAEYDEIVGYHLEQAFRYREELGPTSPADRELALRAAERLTAAGRRAFARRDAAASVKLFSRSAALLPRHDPIRLELLRSTSHMLIDANEFVRARSTLAELVDDATASGHADVAEHARLYQGLMTFMTDPEYGAAGLLADLERIAPIFEELGDDLGRTRIHDGRAFVHDQRRESSAVESEAELALELARRIGDRNLECEMYWWLFWALPRGPRPVEEALRRCEELREQVEGDPAAEGNALIARAQLDAMRDRFEEARRFADASAAIMAELGLSVFVRRAALVHGEIDLLAGDVVAAERAFRQVYEELRPIGDVETLSNSAGLLAEALCEQGRFDEAETIIEVAASTTPRGSVLPEARWRSLKARTLTHMGESAAAETFAREAVELTRESDDLNLRAATKLALAEVLAVAGRSTEASESCREALELYERKGNSVCAARARIALARLEIA